MWGRTFTAEIVAFLAVGTGTGDAGVSPLAERPAFGVRRIRVRRPGASRAVGRVSAFGHGRPAGSTCRRPATGRGAIPGPARPTLRPVLRPLSRLPVVERALVLVRVGGLRLLAAKDGRDVSGHGRAGFSWTVPPRTRPIRGSGRKELLSRGGIPTVCTTRDLGGRERFER